MKVQDVMQTAVTTVTPHTTVSTAYQMMTRRGARIRHLPVVAEEGTLIGIVTDRDVRRALASDAPSMADARGVPDWLPADRCAWHPGGYRD